VTQLYELVMGNLAMYASHSNGLRVVGGLGATNLSSHNFPTD